MRYDKFEVKAHASGQWDSILTILAPEIGDVYRARKIHQPCPVCGGSDRFRLFNDYINTGGGVCSQSGKYSDGFALLQYLKGWNFYQTLEQVANVVGLSKPDTVQDKLMVARLIQASSNSSRVSEKPLETINTKSIANLNRIYKDSRPLDVSHHCTVATYLTNRGLSNILEKPPNDIRCHSAATYRDDILNKDVVFPAMLALVRLPDGQPINIHRTYLTTDGKKAPVQHPKKLMASVMPGASTGCAIQLYPAIDILAVAEGIETALAVYQATGYPTWSTINANGMKSLIIPGSVKTLHIFADKDLSNTGQLAAQFLANRYQHLNYQIHIPQEAIPDTKKSIDWADIYTGEEVA